MIKTLKTLAIIALAITITSCNNEPVNNFTLKGSIKDLKKGVVYLQKDGDSTIIDLDSIVIKGQSEFTLTTNIEAPILLYLKLFKNDGVEHYIPFFADKGLTEIKTSLKQFNADAIITGSKQQKVLEDYLKIMDGFNNQNLDLIKANIMAKKANDMAKADSLAERSNRLIKLKYAATINFAMNNKDSEVAPYLALYKIPNASLKYLDTIYNTLNPDIKKSYYGKTLGKALDDFKAQSK